MNESCCGYIPAFNWMDILCPGRDSNRDRSDTSIERYRFTNLLGDSDTFPFALIYLFSEKCA
jgi:hypothetical protein